MGDTTDRDLGLRAIEAELRKLDGAVVTVGIHSTEGTAKHKGEGKSVSVAQVGAWHEGGTRRMPARPWLSPTIDENRIAIDGMFDRTVTLVLRGGDPRISLAAVGEFAQQKVQAKIRDSDPRWPPLAESTKRAKARLVRGSKASGQSAGARQAGFMSGDGNPLIDTGQLIQSIRYRVELGGIHG